MIVKNIRINFWFCFEPKIKLQRNVEENSVKSEEFGIDLKGN